MLALSVLTPLASDRPQSFLIDPRLPALGASRLKLRAVVFLHQLWAIPPLSASGQLVLEGIYQRIVCVPAAAAGGRQAAG